MQEQYMFLCGKTLSPMKWQWIPFPLVEGRNLIFYGLKFVDFSYLTSASAHFVMTTSMLIAGIIFSIIFQHSSCRVLSCKCLDPKMCCHKGGVAANSEKWYLCGMLRPLSKCQICVLVAIFGAGVQCNLRMQADFKKNKQYGLWGFHSTPFFISLYA